MEKRSYSVFYTGVNFWDEAYSDILYFDTEEEETVLSAKSKIEWMLTRL